MNGEAIVTAFLSFLNQYLIFHWQTQSYSQHKAFDTIHESLEENIDDFVEAFMGKYGRVKANSSFVINLDNYSPATFVEYNEEFINFLNNKLPAYLAKEDTDLLNIRDEILGKVNQLKYLLTLS